MKFAFIFLIFIFLLQANGSTLNAQNSSNEPFIARSDASGEETVRDLEIMAGDAVNTGERFFVIARLGKAERSNRISFARLAYTKVFLLEMKRFPLKEPVFAEGERTDGEGRIEFYLGSRLRLVTLAKRNKIPNLTCCPDYFPPVKRKAKRKNSKNK